MRPRSPTPSRHRDRTCRVRRRSVRDWSCVLLDVFEGDGAGGAFLDDGIVAGRVGFLGYDELRWSVRDTDGVAQVMDPSPCHRCAQLTGDAAGCRGVVED